MMREDKKRSNKSCPSINQQTSVPHCKEKIPKCVLRPEQEVWIEKIPLNYDKKLKKWLWK